MPQRLIDLTDGQIAILRLLADRDMQLVEMDPEAAVHLVILQNRGLTKADKGHDGQVIVHLSQDGRLLYESGHLSPQGG